MVFYRERDERPPISLILPHLYLGAETDVTQECLGARGISYVLSVSRCSPQPSFLPSERFLRIPIDDSLRDHLLPWIPQALRFIDEAVSAGGSVLVHCAAGISRSPALAVAYIMYRLGMDLDRAYRFVKERRPSISPNFNFLGQLQQFQTTLAQNAPETLNLPPTADSFDQPGRSSLDTCPLSTNEHIRCSSTVPASANQSATCQDSFATVANVRNNENSNSSPEQRSHSGGDSVPPTAWGQQRSPSQLTLSLSSKLRTLTLNQNQRDVHSSLCEASTPTGQPETPTSAQLPTPSSFASLSDKRKSLTLSLSPVIAAIPPSRHQGAPKCSSVSNSSASQQTEPIISPPPNNNSNKRKSDASTGVKTRRGGRKASAETNSTQSDDQPREMMTASHAKTAKPDRSWSRNRARGEGGAQGRGKTNHPQSVEKGKPNTAPKPRRNDHNKQQAESWRTSTAGQQRSTTAHQQAAAETKLPASAMEAEEGVETEQSLLSPLNLTVNKLLGWGERMLLGVLLGPRIKVGQAALPYRC